MDTILSGSSQQECVSSSIIICAWSRMSGRSTWTRISGPWRETGRQRGLDKIKIHNKFVKKHFKSKNILRSDKTKHYWSKLIKIFLFDWQGFKIWYLQAWIFLSWWTDIPWRRSKLRTRPTTSGSSQGPLKFGKPRILKEKPHFNFKYCSFLIFIVFPKNYKEIDKRQFLFQLLMTVIIINPLNQFKTYCIVPRIPPKARPMAAETSDPFLT